LITLDYYYDPSTSSYSDDDAVQRGNIENNPDYVAPVTTADNSTDITVSTEDAKSGAIVLLLVIVVCLCCSVACGMVGRQRRRQAQHANVMMAPQPQPKNMTINVGAQPQPVMMQPVQQY